MTSPPCLSRLRSLPAPLRLRLHHLWRFLLRRPTPVPLPGGGWWRAESDYVDEAIVRGGYEEPERRFLERSLRPGMTLLDIGAHHGFYTLLASRRVGRTGRVIAFEPSPRELVRLKGHLSRNRCHNVTVEPLALGARTGTVSLHVVKGRDTGCNSLRAPRVTDPVEQIKVRCVTLAQYLQQSAIDRIDFIKIDAEGAELSILQHAGALLEPPLRPVILCEIDAGRTEAWGYAPEELREFLRKKRYRWFGLDRTGRPVEPTRTAAYNSLAVPEEKVDNNTVASR